MFVRVIEGSLRLLEEKWAEGRGCAEDCAIKRHVEVATGFAAETIAWKRETNNEVAISMVQRVRLGFSGSPVCFAASRLPSSA